jgi:RNA recognition motif-containing protein
MDANFQNQAQAQIMSYYQSGYPAPIAAQQSPSGARPSNASVSIWAGDLDSYMDETFLRNAVAACGWAADITRIKVVRDRYNGMHAGYGFLDAASPEAAARVLATGSGMPIPGTNRCWRLNMGRNAQGAAGPPAGSETNVYVGDLEPTVTDFELLSAFRPRFPSTRHAKVVCNDFGQSRGFGFVRFANSAEAERAVLEMNGFEFHGKPIRLSPANGRAKGNGGVPAGPGGQPRGFPSAHGSMHMVPNMMHNFGTHEQAAPTNKRPRQVMAPDDPNNSTLFIGGTGSHVTEDVLWREFSIFGEVEAVRVPVNKTGFAFVRFRTRENAQRAKDELSGTHFISLNPHKPVRLEWASEQLAISKPSQQAATVGQTNPGYIFNHAVPDPGSGTPGLVTTSLGTAGGKGAASVPSGGSALAAPVSDSLRMTGNPNTGGTGLGESEGPPSKRAAVGRTEYSTGNEPVNSPHPSGGEEFPGKGSMENVPSMSFPWLSTPAAQPSSSPQ